MSSKKRQKVASLLKRFEFTDFSVVVAAPEKDRKEKLKGYLNRDGRGRWKSYKAFRSMVPDIVGVRRGLDITPPMDFGAIRKGLKLRSHPDDLGMNVDAAKCFFDFIRPRGFAAYSDHPRNPLYIAPDRTISMRVEHHVIDGDRGAFQFVNPRREPFAPETLTIAMSLIHYNHVQNDYSEFDVEIVELGCEVKVGPRGGHGLTAVRNPRTLRLARDEVPDRAWLNEQATGIYALLMEIADEPD